MKVLYDISTLGNIHCADGVTGAGIYRATEELALALARRPDLELSFSAATWHRNSAIRYLVETGKFDVGRFAIPSPGGADPAGPVVTALLASQLTNGGLKQGLATYLDDTYSAERVYNPGRFDIYHANWGAEAALPTDTHPTVVATVFDVIALKHPEWFVGEGGSNRAGAHLQRLLDSVRGGHFIIVNTESVKSDILSMFANISDDQVAVVPLAVADTFAVRPDAASIDAARTKYSIPDDHRYVLCVNTLEPRKNMISAIDAYTRMAAEGRADDVSLVLVGSKGWMSDEVLARSEKAAGGRASSVIVTGYVDDVDLAALYAGASLFCYPSLDEGFGMPVLEAMHAGVPVVTSNLAPLVEVSGDAALQVDPLDIDALAGAMCDVLADPELSSSMATRGVERAATFTWDRSAEMTAQLYRRWAPSHGIGEHSGGPLRLPRREPAGQSARPSTALHGRSFSSLRDQFVDKRLFIVSDSEAIERAPLSALRDEFTFAFNDFVDHSPDADWKPTFFALVGNGCNDEQVGRFNALTGSLFFVEEAMSDRLRSGPDVIDIDVSESGVIGGVDLLGSDAPVLSQASERGLAAAIQIGYHLGFDPIILVEPGDGDDERAESLDRWHLACRESIERRGRTIGCVEADDPPYGYRPVDAYEVFASPGLPEFARSDHAHLDETEVISKMILDRAGVPRTMLDVGAHRGTSARHFLPRNWRVFCFEPDQDNRDRLTRGYGDLPNIKIDPRAVGVKAASGIPFFTSAESSGISGLSAFRDTHELVDHVDMTTVADIVDEHRIEHVDFLKIDVEGFDFDVLRGVPWDRIRPDVIECEYENAKTVPLGHTTNDIVEYLRERGYSTYLSEWHPILRYGVRHEWRRVVPYPGVQVPDDSWGNILAFRADPGYSAVQAAFGGLVGLGSPMPAQPSSTTADGVSSSTKSASSRAAPSRKRPAYADWADRLKKKSPSVYGVLQLVRRAVAKAFSKPLLLVAGLVVVAAVVVLGLQASNDAARYAIWSGFVAVVLAMMILWVAAYSHRAAQKTTANARAVTAIRKADRGASGKVDRELAGLRRSLATIDRRTTTAEHEFGARMASLERENATLRTGIATFEQQANELRERLASLDGSVAHVGSELVDFSESASGLGERMTAFEEHWLNSNYSNSPGMRSHSRRLGAKDVERIRTYWLSRLGLTMSPRELRYLAHRVCLDEEACEGRLATSIQAAVMRSLVLLSLQKPAVEVLEIGTLFGVAAGNLHRVGRRAGRDVQLTLIDPLSGYYGQSPRDGQTGVAVSRETLTANLAALGVPTSDYRIIEHLSTDEVAVDETSDRLYDFVLIDGDHSVHGVSNDFELYGPLVQPGGMIVFDDYDTEDWPAIKQFVDDEVRPLDDWLWIGGEWRTGVLQRKIRRPGS